MTLKQSHNPYGYRNLLVYKKAAEMQHACADVTARLTPSSPYPHFSHSKTLSALADQMDRSARSVKQNIVEGWMRNSTREYYEFLGFSLGANAELEEDCNDIIKGIYEWEDKGERGLKKVKGEEAMEGKESDQNGNTGKEMEGKRIDQRGGRGLRAVLGLEGEGKSWTLAEVERLPFYPLDTHLPRLVQLKLRCKELNLLLQKLQKSLQDKMSHDHTLSAADRLKAAEREKRQEEAGYQQILKEHGLIRLRDGRLVRKGSGNEEKELMGKNGEKKEALEQEEEGK